MNVRRASFVRRVAESAVDWLERSDPIIGTGQTTYGARGVQRSQGDDLGERTDAAGNVAPYEADDPAILRKFFGIDA
jgi:hypothetical protein